ncbi:hypothetical protein EVC45_26790 [Paraburkholderia sp. UYCP14C]|uniref:DUF6723 family protein n=1 Tax=Paraburkholderia sp. UYCP14C TaxID=2511130 RepID=UPI00101EAA47|nr:DUF6723 family protein [Paraburkholderia sp. UYCP14C]RZF26632.1 hypothetical protein EVC45_26790 [Paraburkholderia sp. UYCP14C]
MQQHKPGAKNYEVAASFRRTMGGVVPTLKVIRLSDKRVIYPFHGCADMPLYEDAQRAKNFAEVYGWQLVNGDIAVPE